MCHRVKTEFAETNPFHLAIRGMELNPISSRPKSVARMQHRRMLVGNFGELVETPARELPKTVEMRLHRRAQARLHMEIEQVAQPAVDTIEVHAAAVGRDQPRRLCRSKSQGVRTGN